MNRAMVSATSLFVSLLWTTRSDAQTPQFQGLGLLGGLAQDSRATGISADGRVVVGHVTLNNNYYQGFRWNRSEGMVGLPDVPGGETASQAGGVSLDGAVVVGHGFDPSRAVATYWIDDAPTPIGRLTTGQDSLSMGASRDGSVIVGAARVPGAWHAFRWTAGGGMSGLGTLPGGRGESMAEDVSADGSVVVGRSSSGSAASGLWEAFRWTASEGIRPLGDFPGGLFYSDARAVSHDGRVIVGLATSARAANGEPFRWTVETGMVPLFGPNDTPPTYSSAALDVSADGSVIVGYMSPFDQEAFIWDAENGIRLVKDVLLGSGVDVVGWTLREATDVSADGLTLAGWGVNPDGRSEAWIAVVPEPAAIAMLAVAALTLRRSRRPR